MTHAELVEVARLWLFKRHPLVLTEIATSGEEPDAIGFSGRVSVLVECKATRADFIADKNKYFRIQPQMGIGEFRYFLTPERLVAKDELPANWGLLEVRKGKVVKVADARAFVEHDFRQERQILLSAFRRVAQTKPSGVSCRAYTDSTANRATISIDAEAGEA